MEESEIMTEFLKEVEFCKKNIVINDCRICHKVFRQITPLNICEDCKRDFEHSSDDE